MRAVKAGPFLTGIAVLQINERYTGYPQHQFEVIQGHGFPPGVMGAFTDPRKAGKNAAGFFKIAATQGGVSLRVGGKVCFGRDKRVRIGP